MSTRKLNVLGFPQITLPPHALRMGELLQMSDAEVQAIAVDCGECPVNTRCFAEEKMTFSCDNCGAVGPLPLDEARTVALVVHCTKHRFRLPAELYDMNSSATEGRFKKCMHCMPEQVQFELQGFDPSRDEHNNLIVRTSTPCFVHVVTKHIGHRKVHYGGGEYFPPGGREMNENPTPETYVNWLRDQVPGAEAYMANYLAELAAEQAQIPELKDVEPINIVHLYRDPPNFDLPQSSEAEEAKT